MPTYSCYVLKGLVYIIIIAPLGYQPSSYTKYTKLNIRLSCNIKLVFNAKCACCYGPSVISVIVTKGGHLRGSRLYKTSKTIR